MLRLTVTAPGYCGQNRLLRNSRELNLAAGPAPGYWLAASLVRLVTALAERTRLLRYCW